MKEKVMRAAKVAVTLVLGVGIIYLATRMITGLLKLAITVGMSIVLVAAVAAVWIRFPSDRDKKKETGEH